MPGGIGPMTQAMLLSNVVERAGTTWWLVPRRSEGAQQQRDHRANGPC